jgi:GNAT superfamily N-acetyltransferase
LQFEIVYRPEDLHYRTFKQIEEACFPEEVISADRFGEIVGQDFWGVFIDDQLIGYGYLVLKPDVAWISRLGIFAEYRKQGLGSKLMETMLNHCHETDQRKIILYVQQDNPAALRLYKKYAFNEVETTYQFTVPIEHFLNSFEDLSSRTIVATPMIDFDDSLLPVFPNEWSNIGSAHNPPNTYVLIFREGENQIIGYCRLNPDFPGCFPFVVDDPSRCLPQALRALKEFLNPDKKILKLTFADKNLVDVCVQLSFSLSYKLFKMEREIVPF